MSLADEKYVSLTTFTKAGERKPTAIWIAEVDGHLGFTTGSDAWKLKRLRNDPRCELQVSDGRGRVQDGTMVHTATGREATAEELTKVRQAIKAKYGLTYTAIGAVTKVMDFVRRRPSAGNTAIIIDLD